jgi:hypothetical protein
MRPVPKRPPLERQATVSDCAAARHNQRERALSRAGFEATAALQCARDAHETLRDDAHRMLADERHALARDCGAIMHALTMIRAERENTRHERARVKAALVRRNARCAAAQRTMTSRMTRLSFTMTTDAGTLREEDDGDSAANAMRAAGSEAHSAMVDADQSCIDLIEAIITRTPRGTIDGDAPLTPPHATPRNREREQMTQ